MDPPGSPPVKKAKRPSALETKLEELKESLDGFNEIWEMYDPGYFMKQMHQTRARVAKLTPSTIQQFITSQVCNSLPTTLDALDHQLLTPCTDPQLLELTRTMRKEMGAYVADVRRRLKGQP